MPIYNEEMKTFSEACIEAWGVDGQVDMMIEEMAELTLAIQHFKRRRVPIEDVIEEIADVELMCMQMRAVLEKTAPIEDDIERVMKMKMERTWVRMKKLNSDVFDKYNK